MPYDSSAYWDKYFAQQRRSDLLFAWFFGVLIAGAMVVLMIVAFTMPKDAPRPAPTATVTVTATAVGR